MSEATLQLYAMLERRLAGQAQKWFVERVAEIGGRASSAREGRFAALLSMASRFAPRADLEPDAEELAGCHAALAGWICRNAPGSAERGCRAPAGSVSFSCLIHCLIRPHCCQPADIVSHSLRQTNSPHPLCGNIFFPDLSLFVPPRCLGGLCRISEHPALTHCRSQKHGSL